MHICHGSKLARLLLCIALNFGNSDFEFLRYLVWFLSYKRLAFFIFLQDAPTWKQFI
jgi:hypothetical protein